jgi:hypothetical protein
MPDEHEDGKNMPHMECVFRRFFQTPVCPIWLQFLKSLYFPVFLRLAPSAFQACSPELQKTFQAMGPDLSRERTL